MKTIAVAFAAFLVASAHALTLPSLDKKDDDTPFSATARLSFESTDGSDEITGEQLDAIASVIILGANEAHDGGYHLDSVNIKEAGKDLVDSHATMTMLRSSSSGAGANKVTVSRSRYNYWQTGVISGTCYMCGRGTDDAAMTTLVAQFLNKENPHTLKLWEDYTCEILNQFTCFNDVGKCKLTITDDTDSMGEE